MEVHEDFVGLYNVEEITGKAISSMIQDVLLRLQLPVDQLRGQTYDGACNMSGKFHGCQAEILKKLPSCPLCSLWCPCIKFSYRKGHYKVYPYERCIGCSKLSWKNLIQ